MAWADALAMCRAYLIDHPQLDYTAATCSADVPNPRPDRFLRLVDSGSERRTIVHRDSRVTVEAWNADGSAAAKQDAERVYDALDEWELVPDFDGWPSGPYSQPDPETGAPRYVMTCLIRHRQENP